jgi:hypothetical protein
MHFTPYVPDREYIPGNTQILRIIHRTDKKIGIHMAKQEEQKQRDSMARQSQTASSKPARASAARTEVKMVPLPASANVETESDPSAQKSSQIPEKFRRRQLLIAGASAAATAATLGIWIWAQSPHKAARITHSRPGGDQLVLQWNTMALQAIRDLQPPMPVSARALAIVHTCMYDAWAAYDSIAVGTQFGGRLRRPDSEHTLANKSQAISYAAYRALADLFPTEQARFRQQMRRLGFNPTDQSVDPTTPSGLGNITAQAVLEFRHNDGSNQAGTPPFGPYYDYTKYRPINTADEIKNPDHWQPLRLSDARAGLRIQQFACAQWANVTPFALSSALQFIPTPGPARYPSAAYTAQAQQILQYSDHLTDEQKVIVEYWTNGPNQEQPPGHWCLFAQGISQRDAYTLDQNVKLFFALANAALDTSIACWATKRAYDSEYPLTAIHYLFKGKQVHAWAGADKGRQWIDGQYWLPYQPLASITPAFPEYCSEQSAFSAAAAEILRRFTGSDQLGTSYTRPAHSLLIEPTAPANSVTLSWPTLSQAANQAGLAGRYGGIHFTQSDLDGRALGRQVSERVWQKVQGYINGHVPS